MLSGRHDREPQPIGGFSGACRREFPAFDFAGVGSGRSVRLAGSGVEARDVAIAVAGCVVEVRERVEIERRGHVIISEGGARPLAGLNVGLCWLEVCFSLRRSSWQGRPLFVNGVGSSSFRRSSVQPSNGASASASSRARRVAGTSRNRPFAKRDVGSTLASWRLAPPIAVRPIQQGAGQSWNLPLARHANRSLGR